MSWIQPKSLDALAMHRLMRTTISGAARRTTATSESDRSDAIRPDRSSAIHTIEIVGHTTSTGRIPNVIARERLPRRPAFGSARKNRSRARNKDVVPAARQRLLTRVRVSTPIRD
jgi:hypothetical protein